jgi:hypothetical protein
MRKLLKAQTRGNLARDWVSASFYIPRPTHKRLKAWALENDTSLQQNPGRGYGCVAGGARHSIILPARLGRGPQT